MAKYEIQNKYLRATFGDIIDHGFTSVPNMLLANGHKMGLSDHVLLFIIQALRASYASKNKGGIIEDGDLCMSSSTSTLYRIRKELKELKGSDGNPLIKIKTFYEKSDSGTISGAGTHYDFSGLFEEVSKRFSPTGQNDNSVTPPTGQNDREPSKKSEPTGQIDKAMPVKMTDINIELDLKDIIDRKSQEIKTYFVFNDWEFRSDGNAVHKVYGDKIPVRKYPYSLPLELVQKIDELYP